MGEIRKWYGDRKLQEKIKGTFTIYSESSAILVLHAGEVMVTIEKEGVQTAKNQPLSAERMERQIRKTGDSPFVFEALDVYAGDDVFVPMQFLNEIRREGLMELEQQMLRKFRRTCSESWETLFGEEGRTKTAEESGIRRKSERCCIINVSVETREQLTALLKLDEISGYYLGYEMFEPKLFDRQAPEFIRQLRRMGKQVYLSLPPCYKRRRTVLRRTLSETVDSGRLIWFPCKKSGVFCMLKMHGLQSYAVLDQNLYTMNQQAQRFWGEQGAAKDTASLELNEKELRQRHNHRSEMIIYGYTPMMISAQCLKKIWIPVQNSMRYSP